MNRPPRPAFLANYKAFHLHDELFGDLQDVSAMLAEADGSDPLISSADKDLYCLMRSDIMLVDLSTPGFGEQGFDVLFGHLGGMPIIGLTDRFQNAPSLLSRLDCLIVPTRVGQIVRAIELFGGRAKGQASPESNDKPSQQQPTPSTGSEIDQAFASDVLRVAGVLKEEAGDGKGGVELSGIEVHKPVP